jgi:hypothetical protein
MVCALAEHQPVRFILPSSRSTFRRIEDQIFSKQKVNLKFSIGCINAAYLLFSPKAQSSFCFFFP